MEAEEINRYQLPQHILVLCFQGRGRKSQTRVVRRANSYCINNSKAFNASTSIKSINTKIKSEKHEIEQYNRNSVTEAEF